MDQAKANRSIFWNEEDVEEGGQDDFMDDDSSNVRCTSMEWDDLLDVADPTPDFFFDGEETKDETSYLDLPDDIHLKIIAYLDLPSRLSLRGVNKRLDALQLAVRNYVDMIKFTIDSEYYFLTFVSATGIYCYESRDFARVENNFRRLALNTHVCRIHIEARTSTDERNHLVIESLLTFEADFLRVFYRHDHFDLPLINLSSLLAHAKNVKGIHISRLCTSLTAQDLCSIRKAILDGGSRLEHFQVRVDKALAKSFIKECFSVTIRDSLYPLKGRTYRSSEESVELYGDHSPPINQYDDGIFKKNLIHFEGDFLTYFNLSELSNIIITKNNANDTYVERNKKFRIKLNHFYWFP